MCPVSCYHLNWNVSSLLLSLSLTFQYSLKLSDIVSIYVLIIFLFLPLTRSLHKLLHSFIVQCENEYVVIFTLGCSCTDSARRLRTHVAAIQKTSSEIYSDDLTELLDKRIQFENVCLTNTRDNVPRVFILSRG